MLEIKTALAASGVVSFTWNEFKTAEQSVDLYRMLIIEASDSPPETWQTNYCDDPAQYFEPEDVMAIFQARIVAPNRTIPEALTVQFSVSQLGPFMLATRLLARPVSMYEVER